MIYHDLQVFFSCLVQQHISLEDMITWACALQISTLAFQSCKSCDDNRLNNSGFKMSWTRHSLKYILAATRVRGFQFFSQTPYSSYLALTDSLFLLKIKLEFSGLCFITNDDFIEAVDQYRQSIDAAFYK